MCTNKDKDNMKPTEKCEDVKDTKLNDDKPVIRDIGLMGNQHVYKKRDN